MYTRGRLISLLVTTFFSFQIAASSAGENQVPLETGFSLIDFKNGFLKVSVQNQKFQKVMNEVAKKAGVQIVINNIVDKDLTIHFDYLPLEKSLKKLLRGRDYVFLYRSDEAHRSSKLMQVLVFPKSEDPTVAGPAKRAGNKLVKQTKELKKETHNLDQKMLEELLHDLSRNKVNLKAELYEALEGMPDTEGFREMMQQLEAVLQGLPEGVDLEKEIYEALEGIQDMEKAITDYSK